MNATTRYRLALLDAVAWPGAVIAGILSLRVPTNNMGGMAVVLCVWWALRKLRWARDDWRGIDRGRYRSFWIPPFLFWRVWEPERGPYRFTTVRLAKLVAGLYLIGGILLLVQWITRGHI